MFKWSSMQRCQYPIHYDTLETLNVEDIVVFIAWTVCNSYIFSWSRNAQVVENPQWKIICFQNYRIILDQKKLFKVPLWIKHCYLYINHHLINYAYSPYKIILNFLISLTNNNRKDAFLDHQLISAECLSHSLYMEGICEPYSYTPLSCPVYPQPHPLPLLWNLSIIFWIILVSLYR